MESGSWLYTLWFPLTFLVWLKPDVRACLFTALNVDPLGVFSSTSNKDFLVEIRESSSSFGSRAFTFFLSLHVERKSYTTFALSKKWPGCDLLKAKILVGKLSVSLKSSNIVMPYLTRVPYYTWSIKSNLQSVHWKPELYFWPIPSEAYILLQFCRGWYLSWSHSCLSRHSLAILQPMLKSAKNLFCHY